MAGSAGGAGLAAATGGAAGVWALAAPAPRGECEDEAQGADHEIAPGPSLVVEVSTASAMRPSMAAIRPDPSLTT